MPAAPTHAARSGTIGVSHPGPKNRAEAPCSATTGNRRGAGPRQGVPSGRREGDPPRRRPAGGERGGRRHTCPPPPTHDHTVRGEVQTPPTEGARSPRARELRRMGGPPRAHLWPPSALQGTEGPRPPFCLWRGRALRQPPAAPHAPEIPHPSHLPTTIPFLPPKTPNQNAHASLGSTADPPRERHAAWRGVGGKEAGRRGKGEETENRAIER